jgi:DNA (cytosine-5)-methyltransferase 1
MDFESETLIAAPLTAARGAACSHDHTRETFIAFNAREDLCAYGDKAGSLGTSSPQAQAIAFSCKDHGADAGGIAPTLRAMGHSGSHANAGGQLAVAVSLRGREGGATAELSGDVMPAMRTGGGGADKPHALTGFGVRRLTPTECERLQGFPDGHTLIPMPRTTRSQIEADLAAYLRSQQPNVTDEEIRRLAADGPRYRALGNSMAVPVMRWIGQRIQKTQAKSGQK